jgi:hypothetical protein
VIVMRRTRHRVVAVAAALSVLAAACGGGSSRGFEIGLKRVAVDLSFSDPTKEPPPIVITVDQAIATPPPPTMPGFTTNVAPSVLKPPPPPKPPKIDPCPKAGPDAHPERPVRVFAITDPPAGTFTTHNTGTFSLGLGVGTISGPYPKRGLFAIKNIRHDETTDPLNGVTTKIVYDVVETQIDGSEVTTTYQTTNTPSSVAGQVQRTATVGPEPSGALELVKVVTRGATGTPTEFNPSPPVTIMSFRSGEGTTWSSAGIDQSSGTSLLVQGSITSRELVDVCGTIYDTYRVSSTERYTNLNTGFSSQTDTQDPNIYNVATQLGGLFISRYVSTTTTTPTENGQATSLVLKYTSVLDSATPAAIG